MHTQTNKSAIRGITVKLLQQIALACFHQYFYASEENNLDLALGVERKEKKFSSLN